MIAQDLYTFLQDKASIRAIVALSSASPRKASIYPYFLPQSHIGFPALTYSMDDDLEQTLIDGTSTMKEAILSVDCWAYDYIRAHDLADAVKDEMVDYTGTFGSSTVNHCRKERELDLYEPDTKVYRVSLQFRVAYV